VDVQDAACSAFCSVVCVANTAAAANNRVASERAIMFFIGFLFGYVNNVFDVFKRRIMCSEDANVLQ
jgi:hypothetical protein